MSLDEPDLDQTKLLCQIMNFKQNTKPIIPE